MALAVLWSPGKGAVEQSTETCCTNSGCGAEYSPFGVRIK